MIDDNPELTEPISKYLKLHNYEVIVSNDAKNGMSLLLNEKFDTVILDISMPNLSGFEIIDALAVQGKIKNQKIIVFTAVNMSKEEMDGLLNIGIHCCLLKPVEMNTFVEAINSTSHNLLPDLSHRDLSREVKELKQEKMILLALINYINNEMITSHDFTNNFLDQFKNSVTPANVYVDMLIEGTFGDLNEIQKEKLRMIKKSISELQKSITKN